MRTPSFLSLRSLACAAAAGAALFTSSAASAQPMEYYGGRVISNVEVIQVAWGGSINPQLMQDLTTFYKAVLASDYLDWLSEYDTIGKVGFADNMKGSEQHIGRGTFGGAFTITPINKKTDLDNSEIAAELAAQLKSGALPAPKTDAAGNVNTLYMFEMPAGFSINLLGYQACQQYGAYHFTISYDGMSVPYGVHPDCGFDFNTATFVHTHELVEAITDTEPGLVEDMFAPIGRPVAWVRPSNNFWTAYESADICNGIYKEVAGYFVSTNWSNFANGCVSVIPICDGTASPPACRPCNNFDSGVGCSGATPACATDGPKAGQCVPCTAAYKDGCSAPTPACEAETYTCVGCVSSADCTDPSAPVCDTAAKTCHGCQSDAECATGVCDTQADGQQGQCVTCNDDTQCGMDQHCEAHACVDDPSGAGGEGGAGGGGSGGDGGNGDGGSGGGCACRLGAADSGGPDAPWLLAGLLALPALRRRRRAARG